MATKLATALTMIVLAVWGWTTWAARPIAVSDARQLVRDGAVLLDVRTRGEFRAGHIPGAVNIPVHRLEKRLGELGDRDKAVVVYCRSGRRSASAVRFLRRAGFVAVHDLGAMKNWTPPISWATPAGHPVRIMVSSILKRVIASSA